MQTRIDYAKVSPPTAKAVMALEMFLQNSGLDRRLMHLIRLRASLINGCAYCVDMHTKEARHFGLSEQWINLIGVWRESPVYDARERALLGWIDAVTNIAAAGAPDQDFARLKEFFTDEEIVKLTVAIGMMNLWNRMAVSFRLQHPVEAATQAA
jgi:AhpD family alkylhydroperoxidase